MFSGRLVLEYSTTHSIHGKIYWCQHGLIHTIRHIRWFLPTLLQNVVKKHIFRDVQVKTCGYALNKQTKTSVVTDVFEYDQNVV